MVFVKLGNKSFLCSNWPIWYVFPSLFQILVPATPVAMVTAAPAVMATSVSVVKAMRAQTVSTHFTACQSLNGQSQRHQGRADRSHPPWNLTLFFLVQEQPWPYLRGSQKWDRKL